ncbi:MAG TPA: branched-chain amino acid transaminase [Pyrinomonadaceae bacterium]|nr:branched-chain amino acid transaminase [Pyrinomonadaceae bacterium]
MFSTTNMLTIAPEVWRDGEFIRWDDARVHVMSHVLHHGSSVFEGIRCYKTRRGPVLFRLREHIERLFRSAKIYRMEHRWTVDELCDAVIELVGRSGFDKCYVRAIIFRSLDEDRPAFGVNPFPNPLSCYISAWDWSAYMGDEVIERGVDVCVSTWQKLSHNTMPLIAKAGANYMNAQLVKMEALLGGYAEGITLDDEGNISGGSTENLFLVHNGEVSTPALSNSILPGITRDSVIQLCRELEIPVREQTLQRASLYVAEELFFTGTGVEVVPIRSVDKVSIGGDRRGPITERIQQRFFEFTSGQRLPPGNWLTYLHAPQTSPATNALRPREANLPQERSASTAYVASQQGGTGRHYYGTVTALAWILGHYFFGAKHYTYLAGEYYPHNLSNPRSSNPYLIYQDFFQPWREKDTYSRYLRSYRQDLRTGVEAKRREGVIDHSLAERLKDICDSVDIVFFYPLVFRVKIGQLPSERLKVEGSGRHGSSEYLVKDLGDPEIDAILFLDFEADADFKRIVTNEYYESNRAGHTPYDSEYVLQVLERRCL